MAIQIHKKHHGGKVKGAAPGDMAPTGMPEGFIPPVKPIAPDVISHPRLPVGAGFGMSGGAENPSSLPPGYGGPQSVLGKNLEVADGENLLDRIRRMGVGKSVIADVDLMSPQTRDVSKEQYPAAHGQRSRTADAGSPGGMVPSACGASVNDDSATRRAAGLKRT